MDISQITDLELAIAIQENGIKKQQILNNEYLLYNELMRRKQNLDKQQENNNGSDGV